MIKLFKKCIFLLVLCTSSYAQNITGIELKLLSEYPLLAGQEIVMEVRVYDGENLVEGEHCIEMVYQDTVGPVNERSVIKSDDDSAYLNKRPETESTITECFIDGIDTVRITIYNETVKLHQL